MLDTGTDAFSLFPALPPELRKRIWHFSLNKQRIVKLRLRNRILMDGLLARQGASRPKTRNDEKYGVVVDGYQTISKLFRISRDSRDAAMLFYRAQVPCWLAKGVTRSDDMIPGILYFNPEHDFLYINDETGQTVDFIHDLKTVHDPLKKGLLNLAVDINGLTGIFGLCSISPSELPALPRKSFTETLTQLHQVYFVQVQATGRHIFGHRSGAPTSDNLLNLSFPIAAMALNFDHPKLDTRSIAPHLSQIFVNVDPRRMLIAWGRFFFDNFGAHFIPPTEHQILLTFAPTAHEVFDQRDAEEWLHRERDTWTKETQMTSESILSIEIRGDRENVDVPNAFGFWLFPVHAFGALPEDPTTTFTPEAPRFLDLTEHWPELAVLDLPSPVRELL